MAYESMTYENILKRMMARVTEKYPTLDTREGSIIFNALAPAAVELSIMYTELDNVLNESFVDTASRDYLLLGCNQIGMDVSPFYATPGVHKAQFNTKIELGSKWNCDLYNYIVTEYIGLENALYTYRVVCETTGTEPNNVVGDLTPLDVAPNNLTHAKLVECLIEGENETSDDDIRTAYHEFIDSSATDGNITQYERWCDEYDGVGNYKIIPLWNGANTVKVSILSPSNRTASDELVAEFQEYLDPNSKGMGDGKAPIGSIVTVSTATESPVSVSATVTMKQGYTDKTVIDTALQAYLSDIAYKKTSISYIAIGSVILGVEGVDGITNLLINNKTEDVNLAEEEIAILGDTLWG